MTKQGESIIEQLPRTQGAGTRDTVSIGGNQWDYYDHLYKYSLKRRVAAGEAEIIEMRSPAGGKAAEFRLEIRRQLFDGSIVAYAARFTELDDAASAAGMFQWVTREHAGRTWYSIRDDAEYEAWAVHFRPGHIASVKKYKGLVSKALSGFQVEHTFSPRPGENYEIRAERLGEYGTSPIETFEEAAAIACTLPAYVGTLMHVPAPPPPVEGDAAHAPAPE